MKTIRAWRRTLALAALGLVLAALIAGVSVGSHALGIATAFYAKTLCSGVFVSGRPVDALIAADIRPKLKRIPDRFSHRIDTDRSTVSAAYLGLARREALFRPGLGCTLLIGVTRDELLAQSPGYPPRLIPAPTGLSAALPEQGAHARLEAVLDEAFTRRGGAAGRHTRAVVVLRGGQLISERYSEGIDTDTPLIGWSMSKSVVGALIGVLVRENKLSLDDTSLFPQWRGSGNPRAAITVSQLLRMTSGLDFGGDAGALVSPVQEMLFGTGDAASIALSAPLATTPGAAWRYGSGSTLLLGRLIRQTLGEAAAIALARELLFTPLGMTSALLEPDASGTPLGAAFVYASARDWARFGQFLLQDGVWQGQRILPENWLQFAAQATDQSGGAYGAHLWRRTPAFLRPEGADDVELPDDRMLLLGIDGQMVAVVPSHDVVVVRLGADTNRAGFDPDEFLADVLAALSPDRAG